MADAPSAQDATAQAGRVFPERDLEQADVSASVERAQADAGRSREGATEVGPARQLRPILAPVSGARIGRLQLERGLPACGSGARRERLRRLGASTP